MNIYKIKNNLTMEWWEGQAPSTLEACQKAGWPIKHCLVRINPRNQRRLDTVTLLEEVFNGSDDIEDNPW